MPVLFTPAPVHSCFTEHGFDVDINRAELPVGLIWECPDCGRRYIWDGDDRATVPHPKWLGITKRDSDRIIRKASR